MLSEAADDGWALAAVYSNDRKIIQGSTLKKDGSLADSQLETNPTLVVADLVIALARITRVDVEGQRVPGSFVGMLQIRAHGDDSTRPNK